MEVHAIGDRVTNVDADTEANAPGGSMIAVVVRHVLLHRNGTAHSSMDAVEYHEERVTGRADDLAAVPEDRRFDQLAPECLEPRQSARIVNADKSAVANYVGVDDRDQFSIVRRLFG
jgi:hypothetical protein